MAAALRWSGTGSGGSPEPPWANGMAALLLAIGVNRRYLRLAKHPQDEFWSARTCPRFGSEVGPLPDRLVESGNALPHSKAVHLPELQIYDASGSCRIGSGVEWVGRSRADPPQRDSVGATSREEVPKCSAFLRTRWNCCSSFFKSSSDKSSRSTSAFRAVFRARMSSSSLR